MKPGKNKEKLDERREHTETKRYLALYIIFLLCLNNR